MMWTNNLPEELETSLNSLLSTVQQHESVYEEAENSSVAQIWVALAYLQERNQKLEDLVRAQRKALKKHEIDFEVDRHLDNNLEESLKNY